ncbi:MAG: lipopolysaccharide biosynthesis protein [Steroidobacteraceae bacterium]
MPSTVQLYDNVFAGLRSAALAKLTTQVLSWAGMVYIVRQLDSHAFGTYGIATVILSYGIMVFEGGMLEALIQHPPDTRQERRSTFTALLLSAVVLTAAVILLAPPLSRWFHDRSVQPVLALLSVIVVLTALCMLPLAELMRRMNFKLLALISSIQALLATITTVALAYRGYGVWALVWGAVAGALVRAVLLNWKGRGLQWPTLRFLPAMRYARFAGTLVLDNVLFRWYTTVDTLFLGRWAGTGTLGYYTLGQDIANLPLEKIASVVNDVSLPAYSELQADRRRAAHLMLETLRTHATVGFPLFWGLAAVAGPAVLVLFGEKWSPAVLPLMALAFVAPLRLIGSVETPLLTGLGRPDVLLKTKLILVPCMTLALVVGCMTGGLVGASLAWVLVFPICYLLSFRWVLSHIEVSLRQVASIARAPCLSALCMALTVTGCDLALLANGVTPLFRLIAEMALGSLLYPLLLWALDRHAFNLLRERLLRVAGRRAPVAAATGCQ